MANTLETADQIQTIAGSPDKAVFSYRGYWLTKRRDGRSGRWMIARYEKGSRCVVYRSCKTADLDEARQTLVAFAEANPESVPPPPKRASELIYFVQAETGQIKVGLALDVERRLAQIRTMSPVPIRLLAIVEGGRAQEHQYHKRFADHRLHGEWFNPHPDILAEIKRLGALSSRGAL